MQPKLGLVKALAPCALIGVNVTVRAWALVTFREPRVLVALVVGSLEP